MKRLEIKTCLLSLIGLIVFNSCFEDINNDVVKADSITNTRTAFDGYFDWDRISEITTYDYYSNRVSLSLPWAMGNTQSLGIPQEWLDENAYNSNSSKRLYSREKGWVLVYSNLHQSSTSKYFALYNENTGLLRFFLYEISQGGNYGTSTSFWGIAVDKPASLFNFSSSFANGQDVIIEQPSQITTPRGSFTASGFSSEGYKANNWYGIELECAYDPSIMLNTNMNFIIKGWAYNEVNITGTGITEGSINGTIKTVYPKSSSFNLSLQNMFNNSQANSTVTTSGASMGENLGKIVDDGVKKNDSFFTGIWNNFKTNASKWISSGLEAGLEKGISAVLTSGGSVIADAIGGLASSLIGGKNKETVSTVELALNSTTQFTLKGETQLVGWGQISAFPVSGSTSNQSNAPLYNKPLGVWNLETTPYITVDMYTSDTWLPISCYSQYKFTLNEPKIVLNPEVATKFKIEDVKYDLVASDGFISMRGVNYEGIPSFTPYAFINNTKFYSNGAKSIISKYIKGERAEYSFGKTLCRTLKVRVSFKLVNITGSENIYYFSKYFTTQSRQGAEHYKKEVYPEGNGQLVPFPQY